MTTDFECCTLEDIAMRPAEIMRENDVATVPVIAAPHQPKLQGTITDRDLCLAVIAHGRDPLDVLVRDCLKNSPMACRPDDTIQQVATMIGSEPIEHIPVVDEHGDLIGILSRSVIEKRLATAPGKTPE
jgi:CBS domain-containing protein